jgi:hypothetical protein
LLHQFPRPSLITVISRVRFLIVSSKTMSQPDFQSGRRALALLGGLRCNQENRRFDSNGTRVDSNAAVKQPVNISVFCCRDSDPIRNDTVPCQHLPHERTLPGLGEFDRLCQRQKTWPCTARRSTRTSIANSDEGCSTRLHSIIPYCSSRWCNGTRWRCRIDQPPRHEWSLSLNRSCRVGHRGSKLPVPDEQLFSASGCCACLMQRVFAW